MKKIAVITCWFGGSPLNYLPLWLKSIATNPTIQFFYITDQPLEQELPVNLRVVRTTLADIEKLAKERLSPNAIIPHPYKLCDYKPMYGILFQELIQEYDFWGHCDTDMIFGDIRRFLTEERLNTYDKIYPLGHLSFFRNTDEVNRRWELPDAKCSQHDVLTIPLGFAFDEWPGIYNIYMRLHFPFLRDIEFISPSPHNHRFRFVNRTNPKYEIPPKDYPHQVFYWENGEIFRAYIDNDGTIKTDSFVYMHFFKRKFPNFPKEILLADRFFCTPDGFLPKQEAGIPSREELLTIQPYRGELFESLEAWWNKKKNRLKGFLGKRKLASKKYRIPGRNWK